MGTKDAALKLYYPIALKVSYPFVLMAGGSV